METFQWDEIHIATQKGNIIFYIYIYNLLKRIGYFDGV